MDFEVRNSLKITFELSSLRYSSQLLEKVVIYLSVK